MSRSGARFRVCYRMEILGKDLQEWNSSLQTKNPLGPLLQNKSQMTTTFLLETKILNTTGIGKQTMNNVWDLQCYRLTFILTNKDRIYLGTLIKVEGTDSQEESEDSSSLRRVRRRVKLIFWLHLKKRH